MRLLITVFKTAILIVKLPTVRKVNCIIHGSNFYDLVLNTPRSTVCLLYTIDRRSIPDALPSCVNRHFTIGLVWLLSVYPLWSCISSVAMYRDIYSQNISSVHNPNALFDWHLFVKILYKFWGYIIYYLTNNYVPLYILVYIL